MSPTRKKQLEITIIIPCFNCDKTLREAVDSCYTQGFLEDEFEIIMVDDCSQDNTSSLMKQLAQEHSNIKFYKHETNKGGGATRNTATKMSSSELIFCLDSDDMLSPHTLDKMVRMQKETQADGIGIEKSIKFRDTDTNDISFINIFGYRNELIPLESLLQFNDIMCPLYSTFLYTKTAFNKIGGYPIDHGFDTQGFAWRFLAKGLKAYTCPDTTYLHRVNFHESYYLREYNAGRTNLNWKKILLEQNAILSDEAYSFIVNFNEQDFETDIITELKKLPNVFSKTLNNRVVSIENIVAKKSIPRDSIQGIFYRIRAKIKKIPLPTLMIKLRTYFTFIIKHIQSNEALYALLPWHLLRIKRALHIDFNTPINKDNEIIDLFLPTISKDFETLQLVIEAAKKHIQHTIGNIYIVTQVSDVIREYCEKHGYILVDERSILGYGKERINYKVGEFDRSGWLFQQLLKFAADKIVETENFITICTDTILIRPHSFIENGKFIFRQNDEWHEPYFKTFKKIFGYPVKSWFSYTSHMMIFNKTLFRKLKEELEKKNKKTWDQVYIDTADPQEMSCISDYDTYANWVICNFPEKTKTKVFYNRTLSRKEMSPLTDLETRYGDKYHSVSFHSYATESSHKGVQNLGKLAP